MPDQDIEERLNKLEKKEEQIEKEEKEILTADQHILQEIEKNRAGTTFATTLYRFRFLVSILLTVGVVLVWKAIGQFSDTVPVLSTTLGALIVGLVILWVIYLLTKSKQ